MASKTLEHLEVLRMALPSATSWDPESRQKVVTAATSAPQADGIALDMGGMRFPERPLPVYINHNDHPAEFIGTVVALEVGREKGMDALIATVQLADSPVADLAVPVLASGADRYSIRARIHRLEPGPAGSDYDRASDWETIELSLVAAGMDTAAFSRSVADLNTQSTEDTMTTTTEQAPEATVTRTERTRVMEIQRSAAAAGFPELAGELIERGTSIDEARKLIIDKMAEREAAAPTRTHIMHSPAGRLQAGAVSLQRHLDPCVMGNSAHTSVRVLEDWLLETGQISRVENLSPKAIVARAFSTSDFPIALQGLGVREVLNAYQSSQNGLIAAASRRNMPDFRPFSGLRFSALGALPGKKEGGEYKATGFSEEAAYELIAKAFGTVIKVTRESVINDDLGMVGRLSQEAGRAGAETDRDLLAAALDSITWSATNSVSSAMGIGALGAGVLLLRRQIDAEQRPVSFEPDLVLAAPEHELALRQLLGSYQPAAAGDVQPFSNLRLEIDHRLTEGSIYMVDTRYQPLMIGSIGDPVVSSQEDFQSGDLMLRVQHDAAACVVDTRSICKVTITTGA